MANVTDAEITPGLVVYLDAFELNSWPDIETNVREGEGESRLANDNRPFLILELRSDNVCLCVPLFSHFGPGSIELDQNLKSGLGDGWLNRVSYYSRYQFWKIPTAAIVAASSPEISSIGARKRYAAGNVDELSSIIARQFDSDTSYHPIC